MSFIHYKFGPTLEYKNLNIGTFEISIGNLKRAIGKKEGIRLDLFGLVFYNSVSKRQYEKDEELIPRNTSVYYKRIPKLRIPKLFNSKNEFTSGIVTKRKTVLCQNDYIPIEIFNQMSELERLRHVLQISYQKYHPRNYIRKYYVR